MNYGGDAADQIVRYSMEGMEHTLRISGSIAKNLAVLIVAVMKDQKKTRGKTNLLRMLKEQRAMKFFTIPHDRLREFAGEAKSRGLLYVVIRDKKNPQFSEIMVFADDAAKVNRVLDKMNLDFVKSEAGEAVVEQAPVREGERVIDAEFTEKTEGKEELPVKTEKVVLPEGTIEFELDEEEHAVNRELACAALDQHDGNYVRKKVNAQAYCAAYVIGKRYGAEVSGFQFGKVAEMQANGQKDPQELRGFLNDVRQAAYTIRNHMERNFGEQEQTFSKDDFSFEEPPKQTPKKEKKEKQPER